MTGESLLRGVICDYDTGIFPVIVGEAGDNKVKRIKRMVNLLKRNYSLH